MAKIFFFWLGCNEKKIFFFLFRKKSHRLYIFLFYFLAFLGLLLAFPSSSFLFSFDGFLASAAGLGNPDQLEKKGSFLKLFPTFCGYLCA
jgi:hypothetical protein